MPAHQPPFPDRETQTGAAPITPLPLPAAASSLIFYGGVFDPPHEGHIQLPAQVRDAMSPGGWLVYVPAARSPFKAAPIASDADRVAMIELAIATLPRAIVWTDELDRAAAIPGPSYWVETIGRAAALCAPTSIQAAGHTCGGSTGARLQFLLGADQVAQFHRWRDYRRILQMATPLVMLRFPTETAADLRQQLESAGAWTEAEIDQWLKQVAPVATMDISATAIREQLAAGISHPAGLAPAVLRYIGERRLYRSDL